MQWLYENPWPVYLVSSLTLLGAVLAWLTTRDIRLIFLAVLSILIPLVAWGIDATVVTDREYLFALFPRLAQAAEQGEVDTLLAAIDPALRPKQQEARQIMQQIRPSSVVITDLHLTVRDSSSPASATANLFCRIAGPASRDGKVEQHLVGVQVELRKPADRWFVVDFQGERPDPFKKRPR